MSTNQQISNLSSDGVEVILIIASNCSHCQQVLTAISELVKAADIGALKVINITSAPSRAQEYNIRSVPFIKIGPFELFGAHTKDELIQWINRLDNPNGMQEYFNELFYQGELDKAYEMVQKDENLLTDIINMTAKTDTPLGSRIGISAIFEQLQGDIKLARHIHELADLTDSETISVRVDAAHYLGLTENIKAIPWLEKLLNDENHEVIETAEEAISMIRSND